MSDDTKPPKEKLPDLPQQPVTEKTAGDVKGGAMGPGTQTEDDVYVGIRKR